MVFETDEEGAIVETPTDTEVFFNRYSISLQNRLAGAADGLKGLVSGQVRACDYEGQQTALIGKQEYTITDTQNTGDFVVLTLSERLSDSEEADE